MTSTRVINNSEYIFTEEDWADYRQFIIDSINNYYIPRNRADLAESQLEKVLSMFDENHSSVEFIVDTYDLCNQAGVDHDDGLIAAMLLNRSFSKQQNMLPDLYNPDDTLHSV